MPCVVQPGGRHQGRTQPARHALPQQGQFINSCTFLFTALRNQSNNNQDRILDQIYEKEIFSVFNYKD